MSSESRLSQIDPAKASDTIEQNLPSFDANRAKGYAELGTLRSAKSASLVREQRLLSLKYGGATSPRAEAAAIKLIHNEALRRELASTQEVVETPLPEVDENSFVVHGFVRRPDQTGIRGLTLALTDQTGVWQREFGYACTDERGYFSLRIEAKDSVKDPGNPPPPPPSTVPGKAQDPSKKDPNLTPEEAAKRERERAAAAAAAGDVAGQTPGAPGNATGVPARGSLEQQNSDRGFQLRVFNRDGRVLHTEKRLVIPERDAIDYRLIILGDEDCGCTPPPEKSDEKSDPKSPRSPVAPPPAPVQPKPVPGTPVGRVGDLKSYENPPPTGGQTPGQPLEAIRGIGPKRADALRKAGIDDVAEFSKTEGAALVKLAGFDKNPPKARKPAAEKSAKSAVEGKNPSPRSKKSTK